jgi:excisionase family DNA binding protein
MEMLWEVGETVAAHRTAQHTMTTTTHATPERLLDTIEAARFLAVSKRTLQQLTAERSVAVVKFGRNVRYDIADLRRFAESRKIQAIGWKAESKKTATNTGGSEA